MQYFAKVSAGAIALTGFAILAAYSLGLQVPQPFMPPWPSLAFLLAGVVLWAEQGGPRVPPLLLRLGSLFVLVFGAAAGAEHALATDFGFDKLLFPHLLLTTPLHPGRPAPLLSFCFFLLGLTLVLLRMRRQWVVILRELSAATVITVCYFAFVSFIFTVSPRTLQARMSPVAAMLAMFGAAAALVIGANGRLIALLRNTGSAGVVARRLIPAPLILPAFTTAFRWVVVRWGVPGGQAALGIIPFLNIIGAIAIVWFCASQVLRVDAKRREAEEELRESRDELDRRVHLRTRELEHASAVLASVIEACPLGILAFNADGTIRASNASAERFCMMGNSEIRALASTSQPVAGREVTCCNLHLNVWAAPIMEAGGAVDGVVVMAADVSERRALEMQMQQAQKLESLGVLAGGIAHDFNNLLTGVLGNASMVADILPRSDPTRPFIDQVVNAAERAADLTRQLLAYAGKGRFIVEPLNLSGLVREISALVGSSIPKTVQLRLELDTDVPPIEADASQIQQVVMNLVINGAEAIRGTGVVSVRTRRQDADEQFLRGFFPNEGVAAGCYAALEVSDTGIGMDEETQSKIFDPFFTTKFTGRGLGLAAVQGIVRSHNGALQVESAPGRGTTFRLLFPVCGEELPRTSGPEAVTQHFRVLA